MSGENSKKSRGLPDQAYEDLIFILGHAGEINRILGEIENSSSSWSLKNVARQLSEKAKLTEREAEKAIGCVLAFHRLREKLGFDIDAFVRWLEHDLFDFAKEQNKNELIELWNNSVSLIKELFDDGSPFGIFDKANKLVYAHQNLLVDANVLTDLRPVYDKKAEKILRMVITHQLVIRYREGSSEKVLYLTMDASDLDNFENICSRARLKSKLAAEKLKTSGWNTYIPGEKDE